MLSHMKARGDALTSEPAITLGAVGGSTAHESVNDFGGSVIWTGEAVILRSSRILYACASEQPSEMRLELKRRVEGQS